MSADPDDDSEVTFEFVKDEEGRCFVLTVSCDVGMTNEEFAACLYSLSQDIIAGTIEIEAGEHAGQH